MGWFFKSSPNLSQNWLKFKKILEKSGDFDQTLAKNWLVYEWVAFSWKIGICMGLLSNSVAAPPYQNQTWVPPRPLPIFKGDFGRKGYPFLRIFLEK